MVDDDRLLDRVLTDFAALEGKKILVHGGGKIADVVCEKLQIVPRKVDGRRLTDAPTLEIVTMVYAGLINKKIVALLQALGCNALGLTGADANLIRAHKRFGAALDYGFAGDVDEVSLAALNGLFGVADALVVAPITHDRQGQLLNTNADTIATVLAVAASAVYATELVFCFEKKGVLLDPADEDSVIPLLSFTDYQAYKQSGVVSAGMLPKLDNAFRAMEQGVESVRICGVEGGRKTAWEGGTSLTFNG